MQDTMLSFSSIRIREATERQAEAYAHQAQARQYSIDGNRSLWFQHRVQSSKCSLFFILRLSECAEWCTPVKREQTAWLLRRFIALGVPLSFE